MSRHKTIKAHLRLSAWQKTNGLCWYCGTLVLVGIGIDHIIPRSKGGSDAIENLVPCCKKCNDLKSNRTLEEFRRVSACRVKFTPEQQVLLEELGMFSRINKHIRNIVSKHIFYFEARKLVKEVSNVR